MLIVLLCALLLDYFFGEPEKYHPLVGFGYLAGQLEQRLNDTETEKTIEQKRISGFIAVLMFLVPAWWLTDLLIMDNLLGITIEIVILYLALGLNSLKQHARNIIEPLKNHQLDQARQALAKIWRRDTQALEADDISRATTESVLEHGNDAVFAAIFWFVVAGAPGVLVYRLANTMNSMWGHDDEHYKDFGYFIVKVDYILNYIPARLTALAYAFMGNWDKATKCWSRQAPFWENSNAGVVMAAGAGALEVELGGTEHCHEDNKDCPTLGCGNKPDPDTIALSCHLINRSTLLWFFIVGLISLISW